MFSIILFGADATPGQAAVIVIELLVELAVAGLLVSGIV